MTEETIVNELDPTQVMADALSHLDDGQSEALEAASTGAANTPVASNVQRTPEQIEQIVREEFFKNENGSVDEEAFQAYKTQAMEPALAELDRLYGGLSAIKNRYYTTEEGLFAPNALGLQFEEAYGSFLDLLDEGGTYIDDSMQRISRAEALKRDPNTVAVIPSGNAPGLGQLITIVAGETGSAAWATGGATLSAVQTGIQTGTFWNHTILTHDNHELAWATAVAIKQTRESHSDLGINVGAWIAALPELVIYIYHSAFGTEESAAEAKTAWEAKKGSVAETEIGEVQVSASDLASVSGLISAGLRGFNEGSVTAARDALLDRAEIKAHNAATRQTTQLSAAVMQNTFERTFTAHDPRVDAAQAVTDHATGGQGPVAHGAHERTDIGEDAAAAGNAMMDWFSDENPITGERTLSSEKTAGTVGVATLIADQFQKHAATMPSRAERHAAGALAEAQGTLDEILEERAENARVVADVSQDPRLRQQTQLASQGMGQRVAEARSTVRDAQAELDTIRVQQRVQGPTVAQRLRDYHILGNPKDADAGIFSLRSGKSLVQSAGRGFVVGAATYAAMEGLDLTEEERQRVESAGLTATAVQATRWTWGKAFAAAGRGAAAGLKPTPWALATTAGGAVVGFAFPNQVDAVTETAGDIAMAPLHAMARAREANMQAHWDNGGYQALENVILNVPMGSREELILTIPSYGEGDKLRSVAEAKTQAHTLISNLPNNPSVEQLRAVDEAVQLMSQRALGYTEYIVNERLHGALDAVNADIDQVVFTIAERRMTGDYESREAARAAFEEKREEVVRESQSFLTLLVEHTQRAAIIRETGIDPKAPIEPELLSGCELEACRPIQGRALRSEVAAVAGTIETEVLLGPRVELLAALEANAGATPVAGQESERYTAVQ